MSICIYRYIYNNRNLYIYVKCLYLRVDFQFNIYVVTMCLGCYKKEDKQKFDEEHLSHNEHKRQLKHSKFFFFLLVVAAACVNTVSLKAIACYTR